jgi:hypothetical protein
MTQTTMFNLPAEPQPKVCPDTGLWLYPFHTSHTGKLQYKYCISSFDGPPDKVTGYVHAPGDKYIELPVKYPYLILPNGKRTTRWHH